MIDLHRRVAVHQPLIRALDLLRRYRERRTTAFTRGEDVPLDPRPLESGSSLHKPRRITKTGNRHLRTALFMPALVAVRCHGHVKACYNALVARGKRPKQALFVVMRKLLHALWGMLKHAQDFDAARFFQMPQGTQKTA